MTWPTIATAVPCLYERYASRQSTGQGPNVSVAEFRVFAAIGTDVREGDRLLIVALDARPLEVLSVAPMHDHYLDIEARLVR